jgi:hypothetical protein
VAVTLAVPVVVGANRLTVQRLWLLLLGTLESVHDPPFENVAAPSVHVTAPVGLVGLPLDVSVTVAVQVLAPPTVVEDGTQLTLVLVLRPNWTVLSVEVEAVFVLPARSAMPPAGIEAMTLPPVVMPSTATLNVVPSFGATSLIVIVFVPPAVPVTETSAAANVEALIGSLKTAVKLIGWVVAGSDWPAAWLIVTAGAVLSTV